MKEKKITIASINFEGKFNKDCNWHYDETDTSFIVTESFTHEEAVEEIIKLRNEIKEYELGLREEVIKMSDILDPNQSKPDLCTRDLKSNPSLACDNTLGRLVTNDQDLNILKRYIKDKDFCCNNLYYQEAKKIGLDLSGISTFIFKYIKELEARLKENN